MNKAIENNSDITSYIERLGKSAKGAFRVLSRTESGIKNRALGAIADSIDQSRSLISEANQKDLEQGREKGLNSTLLDRLALTDDRIDAMAEGLHQIMMLPDPVGEITDLRFQPSGIQVGQMRVPLGVIGIIYESRPNVTVDAAALCLKSGNATILRGGTEAINSNQAIVACITAGLESAGLPADAVQFVDTTDREAVGALLGLEHYIDVIIPRGGKGLIERVSQDARIPVINHLDGICHVYIDDYADIDKGVRVAFNAKTRRYGICGAMETLLIHRGVAAETLSKLVPLLVEAGVEIRGCEQVVALAAEARPATKEDWGTEYLAPLLSIRVVDDLDAAMAHIAHYGSGHTDSIVTQHLGRAKRFITEVDSSSVMVNTSTQFADGFEYGLGAEIGISTNKLHVRGPVGLKGLTTQKYIVIGDGHIRP